MNKLFDLRFVIGVFFLVVGVLLLGYSFTNDSSINRWCGAGFALFGVVMVLLSAAKPVEEEKER